MLFAWLIAATRLSERGTWPSDWPAPPRLGSMRGIELVPHNVEWARAALGERAEFVQRDMCEADFGRADTVVILDVLHYVKPQAQDDVLRRVRATLAPGGTLLLRVGDTEGGLRFRLGALIDQVVFFFKSGRRCVPYTRSPSAWKASLAALGFTVVEVLPIRSGSAFASVLLVARLQ